MTFENTVLSGRSQAEKVPMKWFHLYEDFKDGNLKTETKTSRAGREALGCDSEQALGAVERDDEN